MGRLPPIRLTALVHVLLFVSTAAAQTVTIDTSPAARGQTIDGFGTCLSGTEAQSDRWHTLWRWSCGAAQATGELERPR